MKNYKLKLCIITILSLIFIGYFIYFPKVYNIYHELTKEVIELPNDFDYYLDKEPIQPKVPTYHTLLDRNIVAEKLEYATFVDYEAHIILILAILFYVLSYKFYRKKCCQNYEVDYPFQNNYDDSIGKYMYWHATDYNTNFFLGERLISKNKNFIVKADIDISILGYYLIIATGFYYILNYIEQHLKQYYLSFLEELGLFYSSGGLLIIVGAVLLWLTKPKAIIDGNKREIFIDNLTLTFDEVYAFQFNKKRIYGFKTKHAYELNLVTNIGERHNLLNHCSKKYILDNMLIIQKYFGVHVWKQKKFKRRPI